MKKTTFTKTILATSIAYALTGCLGGGGGSSSDPQNEAPNQPETVTFNPVVVNSYVTGATVCLDLNVNNVCDVGEPIAVDNGEGRYTIADIPNALLGDFPNARILAYGGTNSSTGLSFDIKMTALPQEGDSAPVTSLTTLVAALVDDETSEEAAKQLVATALGLSVDLLDKDPIAELGTPEGKKAYAAAASINDTIRFMREVAGGEQAETISQNFNKAIAATIRTPEPNLTTLTSIIAAAKEAPSLVDNIPENDKQKIKNATTAAAELADRSQEIYNNVQAKEDISLQATRSKLLVDSLKTETFENEINIESIKNSLNSATNEDNNKLLIAYLINLFGEIGSTTGIVGHDENNEPILGEKKTAADELTPEAIEQSSLNNYQGRFDLQELKNLLTDDEKDAVLKRYFEAYDYEIARAAFSRKVVNFLNEQKVVLLADERQALLDFDFTSFKIFDADARGEEFTIQNLRNTLEKDLFSATITQLDFIIARQDESFDFDIKPNQPNAVANLAEMKELVASTDTWATNLLALEQPLNDFASSLGEIESDVTNRQIDHLSLTLGNVAQIMGLAIINNQATADMAELFNETDNQRMLTEVEGSVIKNGNTFTITNAKYTISTMTQYPVEIFVSLSVNVPNNSALREHSFSINNLSISTQDKDNNLASIEADVGELKLAFSSPVNLFSDEGINPNLINNFSFALNNASLAINRTDIEEAKITGSISLSGLIAQSPAWYQAYRDNQLDSRSINLQELMIAGTLAYRGSKFEVSLVGKVTNATEFMPYDSVPNLAPFGLEDNPADNLLVSYETNKITLDFIKLTEFPSVFFFSDFPVTFQLTDAGVKATRSFYDVGDAVQNSYDYNVQCPDHVNENGVDIVGCAKHELDNWPATAFFEFEDDNALYEIGLGYTIPADLMMGQDGVGELVFSDAYVDVKNDDETEKNFRELSLDFNLKIALDEVGPVTVSLKGIRPRFETAVGRLDILQDGQTISVYAEDQVRFSDPKISFITADGKGWEIDFRAENASSQVGTISSGGTFYGTVHKTTSADQYDGLKVIFVDNTEAPLYKLNANN